MVAIPEPLAVAVTPAPTIFRAEILFAVPTSIPSSYMVRPVIAPAGAALTQSSPVPVDDNTCPKLPASLFLSYNAPLTLNPPLTSKSVEATVVPIPTLPVTSITVCDSV